MSVQLPATNERFLRACRRESVDCTPVWFMRQAGRYMAEYRKIREKASLVEICRDPALCTEVTLQPVEHIGVDAAILFADILLPLDPMGAPFHFGAGEGPIIETPVRTRADVDRLRALENAEGLEYVMNAIRAIRTALGGRVPLIGFAGAPFTLASYLIEGGSTKGQGENRFALTKAMMRSDPESWHILLDKLARTTRAYVRAQVAAGAQAIQIFDSWAGALSPEEYRTYAQPHTRLVFEGMKDLGVPRIHFGMDTGPLLPDMAAVGVDVMGVDWKTPLDGAMETLGPDIAVQGNLDPSALLRPRPEWEKQVRQVLAAAGGRRGHVFNLGHGILKETDPSVVRDVVAQVHEASAGKTR